MNNTFDNWQGESLQHYGVLGMKWGQRRFQNPDGSLTAAGKKHYDQTGEYGYTYKSHATKKYTRKAQNVARKASKVIGASDRNLQENGINVKNGNKRIAKQDRLIKKAMKYQNRAERSAELDRREQEYAQRVRVGGNIATRYLSGGLIGGKAYQQHLAMNKDTTSRGSKVTAAIMSYAGGKLLSYARKANYIRQDEKAAKRAAKGKAADRGAAFRERAAAAKAAFENSVNRVSDSARNSYQEELRKRRNNG